MGAETGGGEGWGKKTPAMRMRALPSPRGGGRPALITPHHDVTQPFQKTRHAHSCVWLEGIRWIEKNGINIKKNVTKLKEEKKKLVTEPKSYKFSLQGRGGAGRKREKKERWRERERVGGRWRVGERKTVSEEES